MSNCFENLQALPNFSGDQEFIITGNVFGAFCNLPLYLIFATDDETRWFSKRLFK